MVLKLNIYIKLLTLAIGSPACFATIVPCAFSQESQICISMPNFVEIGPTAICLLLFFYEFKNGGNNDILKSRV